MRLICAGLSKTGTKSVASALRILGFDVHDVEEQWKYHLDEYVDAMEGKQIPDFAKIYANVDAVTDTPALYFWEEISRAFPDAKILLMVRNNEDVWFQSYQKTFCKSLSCLASYWMRLGFLCTPTGRKWARYYKATDRMLRIDSSSKSLDPKVLKTVYLDHNERVKSSVPENRLLIYNVKQGWAPLCEFLGVEVPEVPFPHCNVKSQFVHHMYNNSYLVKRMYSELYLMILAVMGVLIFAIYLNWIV